MNSPIFKKILLGLFVFLTLCILVLFFLAHKPIPERITYGISFNTLYAHELGLNPKVVYDAFLDDLKVRHLRLAAHWTLIEPEKNEYDFDELDYQIERAEEVGADVVLAIGRRLPRWPECHVPSWAQELSWEEQKGEIREYLKTVVTRYKNSPAVTYWQVENEPYLSIFAYEHCGKLDETFLKEEIALVRELDGTRPILVTDSGNIGMWVGAYQQGDAFGTSMYVYFWNPDLGQFKSILPPWFYRVKDKTLGLLFGKKETILIELAAEPWLIEPVTNVSLETQYSRMNLEKFNGIIEYARESRYAKQYLWGGEWWYWLKDQGDASMWERGKQLFNE